jgi:hypothetical protein
MLLRFVSLIHILFTLPLLIECLVFCVPEALPSGQWDGSPLRKWGRSGGGPAVPRPKCLLPELPGATTRRGRPFLTRFFTHTFLSSPSPFPLHLVGRLPFLLLPRTSLVLGIDSPFSIINDALPSRFSLPLNMSDNVPPGGDPSQHLTAEHPLEGDEGLAGTPVATVDDVAASSKPTPLLSVVLGLHFAPSMVLLANF